MSASVAPLLEWMTETLIPQPKKILFLQKGVSPEEFISQASQGTAFVWQGDYHHAKVFLNAVDKRIRGRRENSGRGSSSRKTAETVNLTEAFHLERQAQSSRVRILAKLLVEINPDFQLNLLRAPDVSVALLEAMPGRLYGTHQADWNTGFYISLRELLGVIGSHEWRKKGLLIKELGYHITPHFGVFSPVRSEYLSLVDQAELPPKRDLAFDIGTGTGVLSAILAKRGFKAIVATDIEPRAIQCARQNLITDRSIGARVELLETGEFPPGKADLIVCNPPWLPLRATSRLERAVYDHNGDMLRQFLRKVALSLQMDGQAWLIISNLAEFLGLRPECEIQSLIEENGLVVIKELETKPSHRKAIDHEDPLYEARSQEITRLFILGIKAAN